jgi:hypothetical protein
MKGNNICPHCGGAIKIVFQEITVEPQECTDRLPPDPLKGLSKQQRLIVAQFEANGLLERFRDIIRETPQRVTGVESFLISWLRTLVRKVIPQTHLTEFLERFGYADPLEIWAAQGIGAVIQKGRIIELFPAALVTGTRLSTLGVNSDSHKRLRVNSADGLRQWLKTRRGYVPAECEVFLGHLRSTAIGDLDLHARLTTGHK